MVFLSGDTVVDGVNYQTLRRPDTILFGSSATIVTGLIIQDTAQHTVTYRLPGTDYDFVMDYNIVVGDTVWYNCELGRSPASDSSAYMVVDSVTNFTDLIGTVRKHIHFSANPDSTSSFYWFWIEGIGSAFDIPAPVCQTNLRQEIVCSHDPVDGQIYHNPNYFACTWVSDISENSKIPYKAYPNPTSGKFRLDFPAEHTPHSYQVITLSGQVVAELLYESDEIDLSPFPNGEYIVRLFDNDGQSLGYVKVLVNR
ncbi:MAG: hypothetical protein SchgKO_25620 [Schleiferiaceae bacterium]